MPMVLAGLSQAQSLYFFSHLNGANEEPPNFSPGTGFVEVWIDQTAHTLRVAATFEDLIGLTTASHIHVINGPLDANFSDTVGPVATMVPSFSGFPLGVQAGSFDQTYDTTLVSTYNPGWIAALGGNPLLAEQELFNGIITGRAYFNIHSTQFPGGEIRGFLQPVPEPGTMALLGIGAIGVAIRRRAKRSTKIS